MIDPLVRRAVDADVAVLAELERDARAAVEATRGGERWLATNPPIGDAWPTLLEESAVFVAVVAVELVEVPVGFLVARVLDETGADGPGAGGERVLVVDQVYVHPDARENGFGDELVAAAAAFGRAQGAGLIEAETLPGSREIKNLYERAGITARLIVVSRRL